MIRESYEISPHAVDWITIKGKVYFHEPGEEFGSRDEAELHAKQEMNKKSWIHGYKLDKRISNDKYWIWWLQK